jgi:Protein of unknown function (DUF2442)
MSTSLVFEVERPRARGLLLTDQAIKVDLVDGRTLEVPLDWYPRLLRGTPKERAKWRLIGDGEGFHWPVLDEDVSVENLLAGKHSGESLASFKRWMEGRKATLRSVRQVSSQRPRRRLERRNEVKHDD